MKAHRKSSEKQIDPKSDSLQEISFNFNTKFERETS